MAILKYIFPLFFCLILTACYEDFTPEIDTTPVLCLHSTIRPGEPIKVVVSRTRLFTDENTDVMVKEATVSVYVNDVKVEDSYLPQEGDRIRIHAMSPKYGEAEAEVTVPVPVPIKSVTFEPYVRGIWKNEVLGYDVVGEINFNLKINLEIEDTPGIDNYFRLEYYSFYKKNEIEDPSPDITYPSDIRFYTGTFQYEMEPIFSEHSGVFESVMGSDSSGFTFFTDKQFSGKTYKMHLGFDNANCYINTRNITSDLLDCGIELTLCSVSESYYNWANYTWQSEYGFIGDLSEIGFTEPLWGYSNVSTGAGIVVAQSSTSYRVNLRDFIIKTLDIAL